MQGTCTYTPISAIWWGTAELVTRAPQEKLYRISHEPDIPARDAQTRLYNPVHWVGTMLCNLRDWHRLGNPARKTEMKQDEPMKYVQAVEVNISKRHQWVYIPCGSGPELHLEHGNRNISGFFMDRIYRCWKNVVMFFLYGAVEPPGRRSIWLENGRLG